MTSRMASFSSSSVGMCGSSRRSGATSLGIARRLGQIGAMTYAEIAREKAAIVERSGLLGEGGAWAGRQMVSRFFIAGFGNAEQRARWGAKLASVAISEPR